MGLVLVDMQVSGDDASPQVVEFLVDNGAVYSALPWHV